MCRHLGWIGAPRSVHDVVVGPPRSLYQQSWAPRLQQFGTVNVDGFGAGWFVDGRPEPVQYRRAQPIWTDASFASLAPTVHSSCLLAAVRSATPGTSPAENASAPFTDGHRLFSHNGRLEDWAAARRALADEVPDDLPDARVDVDSSLLFGLAAAAWRRGATLLDGLVEAAEAVGKHGGGRVNLLAADGEQVAGLLTEGEPLYWRRYDDGLAVASEPHDAADEDARWHRLGPGSALTLDRDGGVHEDAL